eukprot:9796970-Alexandrium_andersonii.AAC.1
MPQRTSRTSQAASPPAALSLARRSAPARAAGILHIANRLMELRSLRGTPSIELEATIRRCKAGSH